MSFMQEGFLTAMNTAEQEQHDGGEETKITTTEYANKVL